MTGIWATLYTRILGPIIIGRIQAGAVHALAATAGGDCTTGHRITGRTVRRYGQAAAFPMCEVWCDAVLANLYARRRQNTPPALAAPAGAVPYGDIDELPVPARWAVRMLNARAARDDLMFEALFVAVPAGTDVWAQHLATLLHTAGHVCADRRLA